MSNPDVVMQDASDVPSIVHYRNPYEVPVCIGYGFGAAGESHCIDLFGNKVERAPQSNIFQIDEDGFEWKTEDGYFWKRKAVDLDLCRDDAEMHEWIRDRENPLAEKASVDGPGFVSFSEEDSLKLSEIMSFDDFDKVVKHIFFNLGNRQRGTQLVHEQLAEVGAVLIAYAYALIHCLTPIVVVRYGSRKEHGHDTGFDLRYRGDEIRRYRYFL